MQRDKADYGLDAPTVVRNLFLWGVGLLLLGCVTYIFFQHPQWLQMAISILFLFSAILCFAEAFYMIWGSRVGKYRERERLINLVGLQGDEKVLDVGCGRGLVLNAVAARLTTGTAVGIDIWNRHDQSGNDPEVTRRNAEIEGVTDLVEIIDGDARVIPFSDNHFDVVLSSLAIHNIPTERERAQALAEILRVVKPKGRIAILDFQYTKDYAAFFEQSGVRNVQVIGPHWLLFPPVRIVVGQKKG
ncbi:Methyltransferase domain-containing protein [Seinonella peptonophila]|uniref:Methyltransferase domain-containing protein n=1 Tax=Seinonella peptonophila TaxID=112248 RepID=A0A1M4Y5S4_9BACL|nr:class I SAM-dependent methyltransferase [Seinonella peptonophila]SHF01111.1 Methyltransferase domain-containing protein [Seinonella peptonophila]